MDLSKLLQHPDHNTSPSPLRTPNPTSATPPVQPTTSTTMTTTTTTTAPTTSSATTSTPPLSSSSPSATRPRSTSTVLPPPNNPPILPSSNNSWGPTSTSGSSFEPHHHHQQPQPYFSSPHRNPMDKDRRPNNITSPVISSEERRSHSHSHAHPHHRHPPAPTSAPPHNPASGGDSRAGMVMTMSSSSGPPPPPQAYQHRFHTQFVTSGMGPGERNGGSRPSTPRDRERRLSGGRDRDRERDRDRYREREVVYPPNDPYGGRYPLPPHIGHGHPSQSYSPHPHPQSHSRQPVHHGMYPPPPPPTASHPHPHGHPLPPPPTPQQHQHSHIRPGPPPSLGPNAGPVPPQPLPPYGSSLPSGHGEYMGPLPPPPSSQPPYPPVGHVQVIGYAPPHGHHVGRERERDKEREWEGEMEHRHLRQHGHGMYRGEIEMPPMRVATGGPPMMHPSTHQHDRGVDEGWHHSGSGDMGPGYMHEKGSVQKRDRERRDQDRDRGWDREREREREQEAQRVQQMGIAAQRHQLEMYQHPHPHPHPHPIHHSQPSTPSAVPGPLSHHQPQHLRHHLHHHHPPQPHQPQQPPALAPAPAPTPALPPKQQEQKPLQTEENQPGAAPQSLQPHESGEYMNILDEEDGAGIVVGTSTSAAAAAAAAAGGVGMMATLSSSVQSGLGFGEGAVPGMGHLRNLSLIAYGASSGIDGWEEEKNRAKVKVDLGTWVYPNVPFPYFFDLGAGLVGMKEREEERERSEWESKERKEREREFLERERERKERRERERREREEKEKAKKDREEGEIVEDDKEKEKEEETVPKKDVLIPPRSLSTALPPPVMPEPPQTLVDMETRVSIVIPTGFIPAEKPLRPQLWGGGAFAPGRPRPTHTSKFSKSRHRRLASSKAFNALTGLHVLAGSRRSRKTRRVYTDDSDVFLCAIHAGWITWSGAWKAKERGRDIKVDLRVIRNAGAGVNNIFASGVGGVHCKERGGAQDIGMFEGGGGDPEMVREEMIGRFVGGFGERCFNELGKFGRMAGEEEGEGDDDEVLDDPEDDGRSLVSGGWGTGHDGSAIEIVNVQFVERGTAHKGCGLGRRNRSQRLLEYSERRLAVLSTRSIPTILIAGRKRRRMNSDKENENFLKHT